MSDASFRVRTITGFVTLVPSDFDDGSRSLISALKGTAEALFECKSCVAESTSLEVQTLRLATNTFEDYLHLSDSALRQQQLLDLYTACHELKVEYVSLGPASSEHSTRNIVPQIIATTSPTIPDSRPIFSCSSNAPVADVGAARAIAETVKTLSTVNDGLGNFNFCSASCIPPYVPFFPCAYSPSLSHQSCQSEMHRKTIKFAVGLENGKMARHYLSKTKSVNDVHRVFHDGFSSAVAPLVAVCEKAASNFNGEFLGLDSSLNPSLEEGGSVAEAIEQLDEVEEFGRVGSLAAAAAITTALQSLPVKLVGYCGLMLPVCEDRRLSHLAAEGQGGKISVTNLLSISSVCGVGVDTVPVEGDVKVEALTSLILDVAGLANRWNKPLSCRVFPVENKRGGDFTEFEEGGWLCNTRVFSL